MLQYLIILLDDTSTSYCHYDCSKVERRLISIDDLKTAIFFGMKENLMIQFVYPDYELPQEYNEVIESIDHSKILPSTVNTAEADVVVFNDWKDMIGYVFDVTKSYVLRICKDDLFAQSTIVKAVIHKMARLNIVITDVDKFSDVDFDAYKECLGEWLDDLEKLYIKGGSPQLNVLTDRMMLDEMNNCGAGDTTITVAPNGKFYICPAFYNDLLCDGSEKSLGDVCNKGYNVGSLYEGLDVKNPQLYKLSHASLCRKCDAYQCKRCVWFNRRNTFEVNTPSHEQCVVAHIERNASRDLLNAVRTHGTFLAEKNINEINYLDPFDVKDEW